MEPQAQGRSASQIEVCGSAHDSEQNEGLHGPERGEMTTIYPRHFLLPQNMRISDKNIFRIGH